MLNSIYVAIKNDFGVSILADYLIDDSLHIIKKIFSSGQLFTSTLMTISEDTF